MQGFSKYDVSIDKKEGNSSTLNSFKDIPQKFKTKIQEEMTEKARLSKKALFEQDPVLRQLSKETDNEEIYKTHRYHFGPFIFVFTVCMNIFRRLACF